MRVLHLIDSLRPEAGGPSYAVQKMAESVALRGHEVHVLAMRRRGETIEANDPDGVRLSTYAAQYAGPAPISYSWWRESLREAERADLVHAHALYLPQSLAAYLRRSSTPYVVSPHGAFDKYHYEQRAVKKRMYEALIENRVIDGASGVHFMSEHERDDALRVRHFRNWSIIPPGVETATDEVSADKPRKNLVLFLGRLATKKQPWLVVDALAWTKQAGLVAQAIIAGPEEDIRHSLLQKRINDRGLKDDVKLIGLVRGEAKQQLLRRASVFVLPSLDESFGIAVVEAMAYGAVPIVTPEVGAASILSGTQSGVVTEGSAEALGKALLNLLERPGMLSDMRRNGVAAARQLTWAKAGSDLEAWYSGIVSRDIIQPEGER
ncbi:glycosyltransferase [Euzebya sp.]|uniref:glycosyltransferase n=1 Tax=Euzebya sp. TaxID=1971409 RepID=UPI0035168A51